MKFGIRKNAAFITAAILFLTSVFPAAASEISSTDFIDINNAAILTYEAETDTYELEIPQESESVDSSDKTIIKTPDGESYTEDSYETDIEITQPAVAYQSEQTTTVSSSEWGPVTTAPQTSVSISEELK